MWAEDDEDDIDIILEAARKLGVHHLIEFVTTGEDLLTKLYHSMVQGTLPQLIVLDNNMPVMTGSDALNRIVEFEQLRTIPVAFFTTGQLGAEHHIATHHAQLFLKPGSYTAYLETL